MSIDFYTALRSRARSQEREARLKGRSLTQAEATAPYVALAETAGERLRAGKSVELAERGQEAQEQQFGKTLEEDRITRAETTRLTEIRLAEEKRATAAREAAEAARLDEQKRISNIQIQMAKDAAEPSTGDRIASGATGAYVGSYVGSAVGSAVGTASGAAAGAAAGGSYAGLYGAVIGAVIGYFVDCVIITACTDPYSYEVNLARKFRDRFMGPETLTGYYVISAVIAPLIRKFKVVRWLAYRILVTRLVDYGEWVFERKEKTTRPLSKAISKAFLDLCGKIGRRIM